jgi:8-oxo-dGTP pyrophosphatase MutT (NUDIX family)
MTDEDEQAPDVVEHFGWPGGHEVARSAYLGLVDLPVEHVSSVRCIVRAAGGVVLCRTPQDTHCVPGGRREPGESLADTVTREVTEETGWLLDVDTLRNLGAWHLRISDPDDADSEAWEVVLTGYASHHSTGEPGDWHDSQGWGQGSSVIDPAAPETQWLSQAEQLFLAAALGLRSPSAAR